MTLEPDRKPHLVERMQAAYAGGIRSHLVERAADAIARAAPEPSPPAEPAVVEPPANEAKPIPMSALLASGLVAAGQPAARTRMLEEIAVAQTQLLRGLASPTEEKGRAANIVMFTSARPGEGKSFCSLNIAASLARVSNRPVLLVDADGKFGSLSKALGCDGMAGLMDLAGDQSVAPRSLILSTEVPRLFVMPYGAATARGGQPSGPLVAAALLRLATGLPQHIIILDTPPCLAASDASTLAPVVGQVVVIVQAERTQKREVEATLDMVEACPSLYLLLNQAHLTSSNSFGAYGGYGGYGDDT